MTSRGNFPGLRTGAKPIPNSKATGQPTIKPRASGPYNHINFLVGSILNDFTNSVAISISISHQRDWYLGRWYPPLDNFQLLQCNLLNSSFSFFQSFLLSIIPYFLQRRKYNQYFHNWYSMKIKEQTWKLAVGWSKQCFEVVNRTDEVSSKYCFEVADGSWRGLKKFSKSMRAWFLCPLCTLVTIAKNWWTFRFISFRQICSLPQQIISIRSLVFFLLASYKIKSAQYSEVQVLLGLAWSSVPVFGNSRLSFNSVFDTVVCWLYWLCWSSRYLRFSWLFQGLLASLWRTGCTGWLGSTGVGISTFLKICLDSSIWICYSLHIFVTWNCSWFFGSLIQMISMDFHFHQSKS